MPILSPCPPASLPPCLHPSIPCPRPRWQYRCMLTSILLLVLALIMILISSVLYGFNMHHPHVQVVRGGGREGGRKEETGMTIAWLALPVLNSSPYILRLPCQLLTPSLSPPLFTQPFPSYSPTPTKTRSTSNSSIPSPSPMLVATFLSPLPCSSQTATPSPPSLSPPTSTSMLCPPAPPPPSSASPPCPALSWRHASKGAP